MSNIVQIPTEANVPCQSCGEKDFIGSTIELPFANPPTQVLICQGCILKNTMETHEASVELLRETDWTAQTR